MNSIRSLGAKLDLGGAGVDQSEEHRRQAAKHQRVALQTGVPLGIAFSNKLRAQPLSSRDQTKGREQRNATYHHVAGNISAAKHNGLGDANNSRQCRNGSEGILECTQNCSILLVLINERRRIGRFRCSSVRIRPPIRMLSCVGTRGRVQVLVRSWIRVLNQVVATNWRRLRAALWGRAAHLPSPCK